MPTQKSVCLKPDAITIVEEALDASEFDGQYCPGWLKKAGVSRSTLKRFWGQGPIKRDTFRSICLAIGLADWTALCISSADMKASLEEQHDREAKQIEESNTPNNLPRSGAIKYVGNNLDLLERQIEEKRRIAITAVTGMGGIGKTELALQYAYKMLDSVYTGGICWIRGRDTSIAREIITFSRNVLNLNVPDRKALKAQVTYCWRHWPRGKVLIIFDDVDNFKKIEPFLPPVNRRFDVIITTRQNLGRVFDIFEVDILNEQDSLKFLASIIQDETRLETQIEEAKALCRWVEYLPLAIEMMGHYLARKPSLSFAEMLSRLEKKALKSTAMSKIETGMTAKRNVVAAFELSWEALLDSADDAEFTQRAVYLFSLLAPIPVNWPFFTGIALPPFSLEDDLADDIEVYEDIRDYELLALNLIKPVGNGYYICHDLIREFILNKLESKKDANSLKSYLGKRTFGVINNICKEGYSAYNRPYETRKILSQHVSILPHFEIVAMRLHSWIEARYRGVYFKRLCQLFGGLNLSERAEFWLWYGFEVIQKDFIINNWEGLHYYDYALSCLSTPEETAFMLNLAVSGFDAAVTEDEEELLHIVDFLLGKIAELAELYNYLYFTIDHSLYIHNQLKGRFGDEHYYVTGIKKFLKSIPDRATPIRLHHEIDELCPDYSKLISIKAIARNNATFYAHLTYRGRTIPEATKLVKQPLFSFSTPMPGIIDNAAGTNLSEQWERQWEEYF